MQWGFLGPQVVQVHQALPGHRDPPDHQVASFFRRAYLGKLDSPARWGLQESQVSMGKKGNQASRAQSVLMSQGLRASQDRRG